MSPSAPAPPSGYPPLTSRPVVRPSGWWYGAAGLIGLVGVVAGVVLIVTAVVDMADKVDDFDRADLPATLEVEITEPGGYTIYHEYDGAFDDDAFRSTPDVTVTDPSGEDVLLRPYDASVTYAFGDHDGEAVYSFRADETGTYEIDAESTGSSIGTEGIAVGRGLGLDLVRSIIIGVLVGGVAVVAAIVLSVVVAVRRGRSRRAQAPPPMPIGWGPPPPGTWGAPPPGWGAAPPAPPGTWSPGGRPADPWSPAPQAPTPPPAPPPPPPQDAVVPEQAEPQDRLTGVDGPGPGASPDSPGARSDDAPDPTWPHGESSPGGPGRSTG